MKRAEILGRQGCELCGHERLVRGNGAAEDLGAPRRHGQLITSLRAHSGQKTCLLEALDELADVALRHSEVLDELTLRNSGAPGHLNEELELRGGQVELPQLPRALLGDGMYETQHQGVHHSSIHKAKFRAKL